MRAVGRGTQARSVRARGKKGMDKVGQKGGGPVRALCQDACPCTCARPMPTHFCHALCRGGFPSRKFFSLLSSSSSSLFFINPILCTNFDAVSFPLHSREKLKFIEIGKYQLSILKLFSELQRNNNNNSGVSSGQYRFSSTLENKKLCVPFRSGGEERMESVSLTMKNLSTESNGMDQFCGQGRGPGVIV